ncbi:MAG TPA: 16S rRNA (guanine(966)-N(2))-methyltransferase RsmD [Candidatus Limnocylindrales bacterium]
MSDAGRVIAGAAKGTRLLAPGEGTRPFGDRVKQTLFAILEPDLRGAAVLDLFAGSGAGGIEALSRGAARAVFVERDATAARVIAENLGRARVADRGSVIRADAIVYLGERAGADGPFDLVLLDPPYAESDLLESALARLAAPAGTGAPILDRDAWVVAKHFWRTPLPQAVGLLASVRSRRFGETALTFYRQPAAEPEDVEAARAQEALR